MLPVLPIALALGVVALALASSDDEPAKKPGTPGGPPLGGPMPPYGVPPGTPWPGPPGSAPPNWPGPGGAPGAPGQQPGQPGAPPGGAAPGPFGLPIPGFPGGIPGMPAGFPGFPGFPGAGTGPGGAPGADAATVQTGPNGAQVLTIDQSKKPGVYSSLASQFIQGVASPQPIGPGNAVSYAPTPTQTPALQWVTQQSQTQHVLISLTGAYLAAVKPGDEVVYCNPQVKQWAVLASAGGAGAIPGMPAGFPGFPAGFPGIPGFPGTTVPASGTTPEGGGGEQPPPPGTTIPGPFGPITIPNVPGFNTPPAGGGTPPAGGGQPAPGGFPGLPAGFPQIPGWVTPGPSGTSQGNWPSDHYHVIRSGDIASNIAQWFTGNYLRAEELRALNGLTKTGTGSSTQYHPWALGQLLRLPLDWNVSKGPYPGLGQQGAPTPNPGTSTVNQPGSPPSGANPFPGIQWPMFSGESLVGNIDRLARSRAASYGEMMRRRY